MTEQKIKKICDVLTTMRIKLSQNYTVLITRICETFTRILFVYHEKSDLFILGLSIYQIPDGNSVLKVQMTFIHFYKPKISLSLVKGLICDVLTLLMSSYQSMVTEKLFWQTQHDLLKGFYRLIIKNEKMHTTVSNLSIYVSGYCYFV